ncbi:unnamed protein product [Closterium sp. NIES-53]
MGDHPGCCCCQLRSGEWCMVLAVRDATVHAATVQCMVHAVSVGGVVKLWEITQGAVVANYGVISVSPWFSVDLRFGCLSVHLECPQCFSAEIYATDLDVPGASEDLKVVRTPNVHRGLSEIYATDLDVPGASEDLKVQHLPHVHRGRVCVRVQERKADSLYRLSLHLECPQCFSAEIYATDLDVPGASEDLKKRLPPVQSSLTPSSLTPSSLTPSSLTHSSYPSSATTTTTSSSSSLSTSHTGLRRSASAAAATAAVPAATSAVPAAAGSAAAPSAEAQGAAGEGVGAAVTARGAAGGAVAASTSEEEGEEDVLSGLLPSFEFPHQFPPSIITEGPQFGPWRRRVVTLAADGAGWEEARLLLPGWCADCVWNDRLPQRDPSK